MGTGNQSYGQVSSISEFDDPGKEGARQALTEEIGVDIHDAQREVSGAGVVKAGTGNFPCLLTLCNQAASWVEVFINLTKKQSI